jgi:plasmid stabilization system protein ParE
MPTKIYWTRQAQEDLRAIRLHISRDAPATAKAYVRKLRASVARLEDFPYSGEIVPELGREELREIFQGSYRLIYRASEERIVVLAVFHGAQILDARDFF